MKNEKSKSKRRLKEMRDNKVKIMIDGFERQEDKRKDKKHECEKKL